MSSPLPGSLTLSPEQELAARILIGRLLDGQRVMVLAGAAGTGKTTLMRELIVRLYELGYAVRLAAPTGKAASRLASVTGIEARTLHSLLFGMVTEGDDGQPVFSMERDIVEETRTVLIVDEASMVGSRMARAVERNLPRGSAVIYVGDHCQLKPVLDSFGVNFDSPDAVLSEVHRQALESPILRIATDLRLSATPIPHGCLGDAYERRKWNKPMAARWFTQRMAAGADIVGLVSTNRTRRGMNNLIREELGHKARGLIVRDDRLLILHNNRQLGKMNGDIVTVLRVERTTVGQMSRSRFCVNKPEIRDEEILKVWWEGGRALVHPGTFGMTIKELKAWAASVSLAPGRFIVCDHGFAVTGHKMQGSEADEGLIIIDRGTRIIGRRNPDDSRRWIYTALTRFRERIMVVDT